MSIQMLWGSSAEKVVTESFARAKMNAERERQDQAAKRLDLLEDDWRDQLWEKIRRTYDSPVLLDSVKQYLTVEHNITKKVVTDVSSVYRWGAKRELEDPFQNRIARLLWEETQIDETLDQANLYTTLLRDILLVPMMVNGRMKIEVVTPDRFSVIQHPKDPTDIVAFSWERTRSNTPIGRDGKFDTTIERVYADAEEWGIWDQTKSRWLARWPHGLGRLPCVVVHADRRRDSFFSPTAMQDVVDATLSVGLLMVMLMHLQKYQSELQPTFAGRPEDAKVGMDVGGHNLWTGEGTFGTLNLQATPEYYIQHINQRIAWVAPQHGLSPDAYHLTGNLTSGFQFRLQRIPLLEARERQKKQWRRIEKELWALMALVAKQEHPLFARLDPSQRISVNPNEEPMIEDPMVRNRLYRERIDLGAMSHVDMLMTEDPDLTREEALKKAARIRDDRKTWIQLFQETNAPADAMDVGKSPADNGRTGAQRGSITGPETLEDLARARRATEGGR